MKFTPQAIPDVVLIEPQVHADARGYFFETITPRATRRRWGATWLSCKTTIRAHRAR